MKTVVAIHTAIPMLEPTKELFAKYLPGVRLVNIIDESLIQDAIKKGGVSNEVRERLMKYFFSAFEMGADAIFNTCSSMGDIALSAKKILNIPVVKIDDAMACEAVEEASRIGVMATITTTLDPTVRLIKHFAKKKNKSIKIEEGLAEGAFQAVISGDREKHDQLIRETAKKMAHEVDVLVLAQGSMARMAKPLEELTRTKVLSSPESGVLDLKRVLELM